MNVRLGFLGLIVSALPALSGTAQAETRALVVGVSEYPKLAETIWLKGPKNDSREMANMLARLGVPAGNITVLADGTRDLAEGIHHGGFGTKKAILDGLDRLAETSQRGDLVVFYFSGHGAQQPDLNGDEEGGRDGVFLPYDTGKWGGEGVENGLVDDELSARIQVILDKGVDFFGIIDACHSATGFRDVPGDDSKVRQVDGAELGIPDSADAPVRGVKLAKAPKAAVEGRGRAAFFYAAQENEAAKDKPPAGSDTGESFGVFTYSLLSRLNQTTGLTYRTLHQSVMADIKRNTLMATQTPEMEGELIDEPVLRLTSAETLKQWQIFSGKLQAGQLAGVKPGAIVALYTDPAAKDEEAVAHGIVDSAGATISLVSPIAYPCTEALGADGKCPTAVDPAQFKKGRFARVVEQGTDFSVVLSEPLRLDAGDGQDYSGAVQALKEAVASAGLSSRVSLRSSGYDIAVGLVDGKLAFAPSAGSIDRLGKGSSPRLTLPADPQEAAKTVTEALDKITRALALQRLAAGLDLGNGLGLETKLQVSRYTGGAITGGECPEDESDYAAPVDAGDNPTFGDCDTISFTMTNTGKKPVDVTALLVGADFSITPVWPTDSGSSRILPSRFKETEALLRMQPNPAAASEERVIFIGVSGVNKSNTVFDNLEQAGLRAAPGEDAPEVAAARELLAVGLGEMSRSTATQPAKIAEEMQILVEPLLFGKGAAN